MTFGERVANYAEMRQQIRDLEADVETRKKEANNLEEELLEEFAGNSLQNMKLATGQTVYINREVFASLQGDILKAHTALRRAGVGDLIKKTVNSQTLRAWVREVMAEQGIPKGLQPYINVTEKFKLRMRR